jgi:protein kinase-like protein
MSRPVPTDPLPERFGNYRVLALLGSGGMGRVYRALDESLQREVALKTLLPALAADADFVTRFTREARAAASLNHPNITQVYATGQEGPIPYFAMELIHGRSLDSVCRETGALAPRLAAGYIRQAAEGLRHAARKGLIHRDIKPSNLMLTEDGVVKVTDFGLAKAAGAETGLTATGEVLGSPGYISPEQAQGKPLDSRSDMYSLGATFFQLVTGRLPFQAPTAVAMILKHMNEPLRSPRVLNPAIPFPIAAIIQRMMSKSGAERFQDYDALIAAIDRAIGDDAFAAAETGLEAPLRQASVAGPEGATSPMLRPPGATRGVAAPARTVPLAPGARPTRTAGRDAAPPVPLGTDPDASRRGLPLLPAGLMIAVASLITLGIWQGLTERARTDAPEGKPQGAAVPTIDAAGSYTNHPSGASPESRQSQAAGLLPAQRAELLFLESDQESLPKGGLRVHGRVRNAGEATARQARVRVRVILEGGQVAAQGETPLAPTTLAPGQIAAFDLILDYAGPAATVRSEVIWSE